MDKGFRLRFRVYEKGFRVDEKGFRVDESTSSRTYTEEEWQQHRVQDLWTRVSGYGLGFANKDFRV